MIACKFLARGAVGPFSRFSWPVPGRKGARGAWVESRGGEGIHACRPADLAWWIDDELWRAELAGPVEERHLQVVATRARLLARVAGWEEGGARDLALECAMRCRDLAAASLEALGLGPLSRALRGVGSAPELREAALAAAEAAPGGEPWLLAGYAADAASCALAGNAAGAAYVAARAASVAEGPDAFAAERARQGRWLAARLGL
jgi:hypothetical protein